MLLLADTALFHWQPGLTARLRIRLGEHHHRIGIQIYDQTMRRNAIVYADTQKLPDGWHWLDVSLDNLEYYKPTRKIVPGTPLGPLTITGVHNDPAFDLSEITIFQREP